MLRKISVVAILGLTLAMSVGCDEEKAPEEKKEDAPAAAPTPAEKTADEKAKEEAEKKALAEAEKKKAEAEAAEAKLQENPLTECCRALAQQAFMQRSADFKAGETVCGEAMKDGKQLAAVKDKIVAKLNGKPLPEPCTK